MTRPPSALRVVLLASTLLPAAAPLPAQIVGGIVRDARTGGVVEHATVVLRNAADSSVAVARTDSLGTFYLTAPAPDTYTLRLALGAGPEHVGAAVVLRDAEAFHQAEYAIEVRMDAPFLDFQVDAVAASLGLVPPRYPVRLLDGRVEGHAVVQYVVDANGHVERESVRNVESTHPEFAAAIPDALLRTRFRAATIAGRSVRQLVQERYAFTFVNRTPTIRLVRERVSRVVVGPGSPN